MTSIPVTARRRSAGPSTTQRRPDLGRHGHASITSSSRPAVRGHLRRDPVHACRRDDDRRRRSRDSRGAWTGANAQVRQHARITRCPSAEADVPYGAWQYARAAQLHRRAGREERHRGRGHGSARSRHADGVEPRAPTRALAMSGSTRRSLFADRIAGTRNVEPRSSWYGSHRVRRPTRPPRWVPAARSRSTSPPWRSRAAATTQRPRTSPAARAPPSSSRQCAAVIRRSRRHIWHPAARSVIRVSRAEAWGRCVREHRSFSSTEGKEAS